MANDPRLLRHFEIFERHNRPSSGIAGSRSFGDIEELHSRVNDAILRIDENSVIVLKNLRSRGEKHDAHRQRV
jgi:hypothetical protein